MMSLTTSSLVPLISTRRFRKHGLLGIGLVKKCVPFTIDVRKCYLRLTRLSMASLRFLTPRIS